MKNTPQHIAIIMDGNRRWARSKGLPDIKGHEAGAETLEKLVEEAEKFGIKTITVYALSTENIKERAKREVLGLFNLFRTGYHTRFKKMMQRGVRVAFLGEMRMYLVTDFMSCYFLIIIWKALLPVLQVLWPFFRREL